MARIVEFRSSEQPHMSITESMYYRLAEPLVFRDLDGVLGDIVAACCRRCGEVTLRSDEVANHLCISSERTDRLVAKGIGVFREIVARKDTEATLAALQQRVERLTSALRASHGIIHEGMHGGKATDPEHQERCERPACKRIRAALLGGEMTGAPRLQLCECGHMASLHSRYPGDCTAAIRLGERAEFCACRKFVEPQQARAALADAGPGVAGEPS